MMNIFTIVNVTPHIRDNLEDKSMLAHFKKALIYLDTHLKEELTDLFWKLLGYSLFPKCRVDREWSSVLMVSINAICKR